MYLSAYKLVVSAEADSKDMTLLETVKAELGITVTTYDALLATLIQQASAAIVAYCNREFAEETVVESYRLIERGTGCRTVEALILARVPVTVITSVVEDGTTLGTDEYEVDADTGFLWKLDGDDNPTAWSGPKIVVTYDGGYEMLDTLPQDLEAAAIAMVKGRYFARSRDPMVKDISIVDVGSESYWVGDAPGASTGIPTAIAALLDPYRRIVI